MATLPDTPTSVSTGPPPYPDEEAQATSMPPQPIEKIMLEGGNIGRIGADQRSGQESSLQIALLWISCNLTAENVILGMLGPLQYRLTFVESLLCGIGGATLGAVATSYVATFGPKSGHRTMAINHFIVGWFPAKVTAVLNFAVLIGYLVIDAVAAGQILAAVSAVKTVSVMVGIILSTCLTSVICIVGIKPFQLFERYAWLSQALAICILVGVAAPGFDTTTMSSANYTNERNTYGSRISLFGLCLAGSVTYAPSAANLLVYLPESTKPRTVFIQTMVGLVSTFTVTFLTGIGLGSGVRTTPNWQSAYQKSPGTLIAESLSPLGHLGTACGAVLALGVVANMVMPSYSISSSLQAIDPWFSNIPRPICTLAGMVVCVVCAVAGRASLATIMTNFVSLMGYWVTLWTALFLEEDLIFRKYMGLGYHWDSWNDRRGTPLGYASSTAFGFGWVMVILCMSQTWYTGPIARMISADIASLVGFGTTAIIYPILRYTEIQILKR